MLFLASGIFQGWKHETFGQCFLDYAWLIQEELPQEDVYGGSGGKSSKKSKKKKPIKSRNERDLMEVLTILTAVGVLNGKVN